MDPLLIPSSETTAIRLVTSLNKAGLPVFPAIRLFCLLKTEKPFKKKNLFFVNSTTMPTFRKHRFFPKFRKHRFFSFFIFVKKSCYYAHFVLRKFTTTPVFEDHQFVFSSQINPATTRICVRERKKKKVKTKRQRLYINNISCYKNQ